MPIKDNSSTVWTFISLLEHYCLISPGTEKGSVVCVRDDSGVIIMTVMRKSLCDKIQVVLRCFGTGKCACDSVVSYFHITCATTHPTTLCVVSNHHSTILERGRVTINHGIPSQYSNNNIMCIHPPPCTTHRYSHW